MGVSYLFSCCDPHEVSLGGVLLKCDELIQTWYQKNCVDNFFSKPAGLKAQRILSRLWAGAPSGKIWMLEKQKSVSKNSCRKSSICIEIQLQLGSRFFDKKSQK